MLGHSQQNFGQQGTAEPFNRVAARRHPLVAEVRRRLDQFVKPPLSGPVVIGVSGGADSVALALAMDAVAATLPSGCMALQPIIAHVHHHLREDADEDAAFVCGLGARLGQPVHLLDVFPGERSGNVSANARQDRYAALAQLARSVRASAVIVAHHAEDQLETVLMHLGRGCSINGLSGMPWVGPLPMKPAPGSGEPLKLVRPMLGIDKETCQSMCEAAGIEWREDPTNRDRASTRTRLRQDVLPVLESLWPGIARRTHHLTDTLVAAGAALDDTVATVFGPIEQLEWERTHLAEHAPAIIASGLRRAAQSLADACHDGLDAHMLEQAALMIGDGERRPRSIDWPGGVRFEVDRAHVRLLSPESE